MFYLKSFESVEIGQSVRPEVAPARWRLTAGWIVFVNRWPNALFDGHAFKKAKCGTKKELSIGFKRFEIGTKMGSFYANLESIHFLGLRWHQLFKFPKISSRVGFLVAHSKVASGAATKWHNTSDGFQWIHRRWRHHHVPRISRPNRSPIDMHYQRHQFTSPTGNIQIFIFWLEK